MAGIQVDRSQLDEQAFLQAFSQRPANDLGRLCLTRLGPRLGLCGILWSTAGVDGA
jgi:hypothetical protein